MVMRNKLLAPVLAATLVAGTTMSGLARADQMSQQVFDETRPSGAAMILDAAVARPLLLGATLVGGVLFIGSLPFAVVGGTTEYTWDTLVVTPGEQTFIRCLGCTPVQHERIKAERKTELAQEAARQQAAPQN